jgi:hypothetical protein
VTAEHILVDFVSVDYVDYDVWNMFSVKLLKKVND